MMLSTRRVRSGNIVTVGAALMLLPLLIPEILHFSIFVMIYAMTRIFDLGRTRAVLYSTLLLAGFFALVAGAHTYIYSGLLPQLGVTAPSQVILGLFTSRYIFIALFSVVLYSIFIYRRGESLFRLALLTALINALVLTAVSLSGRFYFHKDFFTELAVLWTPQITPELSAAGHTEAALTGIIRQIVPGILMIKGITVFYLVAIIFFSVIYRRIMFSQYKIWFLRIPHKAIWFFIGLWAYILYARVSGLDGLMHDIIFNLLLVTCFFYIAQGLGIVSYYLRYNPISGRTRLIILAAVFLLLLIRIDLFIPLFFSIVFSMGLFDQWFNYRKL